MTPALFARIADSLTVYSRQPGINPATASRDVLLAVPGVTPEQVDAYHRRTRAKRSRTSCRCRRSRRRRRSPPAPCPVWRISVQATMPDGVTFVREAVLRPSADPRRPIVVLAVAGRRAAAAARTAAARPTKRLQQDNGIQQALTSGSGCASCAAASGCPRSGAGGWPSSRRWCPRRRAPRCAAGGCARCSRSSDDDAVLWAPRVANGALALRRGRAHPACPATRRRSRRPGAPRSRRCRVRLRRHGARKPGSSSRCRRARCCARRSRCRRRSRKTSKQALALRSRPPHAVQARPALFRRRRRRARSPRRRRSASIGRRRSGRSSTRRAATPRAGARRSSASRPSRRRATARSPATEAQPAARRRAARRVGVAPLAVLGSGGADRGRRARRRRAAGVAEARLRDRADAAHRAGARAGRRVDALREQLERRPATTTSRCRRKYAFPSAVQLVDDVTQAASRRHLAHAARDEEHCPRARSRIARSCCAARAATPGASFRCSRIRSCSSRRRRARRRPRSSPGRARSSIWARS